MNIELREFQQEKVDEFVRRLRQRARDARDGDLQAVSLSSPTGSGKTVMLIEAIERLLQGDEQAAPDPSATFLWITDQPELNAQTRDKMLAFSTVLAPSTLTILDAEFDAEQFPGGQVFFLNTQKLGKNSLLVSEGDRRNFPLWETINNTARARPGSFYVIIDEAHRGMTQTARDRNEANAIIQKFILGSPGQIAPVPLIVGISATPQRFLDLLNAAQSAGNTRTTASVAVDVDKVRSSGLIKEAIQFMHPDEKQPSDMTLLRAAVQSWKEYGSRWATYCQAQNEPPVRPLLAVQVQDSKDDQGLSQTDIGQALAAIEAEAGPLPDRALAHAFQGKTEIDIAGRRLRYLPPSEIAADPDAQIVFFKTSLTTGWDCPRAEVMMSFRSAADATYIAQLVGRMVRTPLARSIEADEHLNTVALYLPHYDEAGLNRVIEYLKGSDAMPPTEVRTEPALSLSRAPESDTLFDALAALPSYSIPRVASANETKRLMKMALRLSLDKLRPNAPDQALALLLEVIDREFERVKDTPAFKAIVDERSTLDIHLVSYLYGDDAAGPGQAQQIAVSPENIEDLFETAGRKIGEGLHRDWRTKRAADGTVDPRNAKLEFVALASADLKRDLDAAAKKQAQGWQVIYQKQIAALPESRRQVYDDIQGLAGDPELALISYPQVIDAEKEGELWPKHLYVDESGEFQAKFNGWETPVLKAELKRPGLRGWLRVVPRKSWALKIPFRSGGKTRPVYVDFLMVRDGPNGLVVDIIDPHNPNLGDAADKLSGLAAYAEQHGGSYGRIESIIIDNDDIRRLNLQDKAIRERAKTVRTATEVQRLFAEAAVTPPTG